MWDETAQAWLVLGYRAARQVLGEPELQAVLSSRLSTSLTPPDPDVTVQADIDLRREKPI